MPVKEYPPVLEKIYQNLMDLKKDQEKTVDIVTHLQTLDSRGFDVKQSLPELTKQGERLKTQYESFIQQLESISEAIAKGADQISETAREPAPAPTAAQPAPSQ